MLMAAICLPCTAGFACGPEFQRSLLFDEEEFLSLPAASFEQALKEIDLPKPGFVRRLELPQGVDASECGAAMADLGFAPRERSGPLEWIANFRREFPGNSTAAKLGSTPETLARAIRAIPIEFPAEFRLYFAGALAYYSEDFAGARQSWQELLALPENSRRQRSVWAEFMLAKTAQDPQEALLGFRSVRALAESGFQDRLGLAFASLGEEARIELYRNQNISRAMLLYAERHASSPDNETLASLRWASAVALGADEGARNALIGDLLVRRIVTAYVLSGANQSSEQRRLIEQGMAWQDTVEKSGLEVLEDADRLAWAAYRGGDFEGAARWLEKVGQDSPVSLWVGSKLAARAGNLERARELLARIDTAQLTGLTSAGETRVCDEIGAIEVSQGDYSSALESFGKGSSWRYAAYVAESLMTVSELRAQVDRLEVPAPREASYDDSLARYFGNRNEAEHAVDWLRLLRDLLARRLARASDFQAAAAYSGFPDHFRRLLDALAASKDQKSPRSKRADALFSGACTLRRHGLELLGTELEPDMAINWGSFPGPPADAMMARRAGFKILRPGPDELAREAKHRAVPDKRFHYRHVAAEMAWKAVDLLGKTDPETRAEYLYAAGSWLKYRDPEAADRFFKRLVRTCRGTELAKEAERLGWFPTSRSSSCPI